MKTVNSQFESQFEKHLREIIESNPSKFNNEILEFIFAPSKRIRPRLIFACLRALEQPITPQHMKAALATELLHSATLIHDDVVDESLIRRGLETFYKKHGLKMSVILGDYLLSIALKLLCELNNPKILEIFSQNLIQICNGEINQYFLKNKTPTLEDYIEKTTQKTALLFVCGVSSALELCEIDPETKKNMENFALNFGIAFQIKDDIDDNENVCDSMKEEFKTRAAKCLEFLKSAQKLELMGFLDNL